MNAKMPWLLTVLGLGLFAGFFMTVQPYSAWHGQAYAEPAQRYVQAALRQDSVKLARLSAASTPVSWALQAARMHPESLALWIDHPEAWIGAHYGDTTEVFLYPSGEACSKAPILIRFVGSGRHAKVLSATSRCLPPIPSLHPIP
jgi:hypothetical protein